MTSSFDYHRAFSRNIGWVTRAEQDLLRKKRVAIAGMGGVGGIHLLTLARLGKILRTTISPQPTSVIGPPSPEKNRPLSSLSIGTSVVIDPTSPLDGFVDHWCHNGSRITGRRAPPST